MQSRRAAFAAFRKLATQGPKPSVRAPLIFNKVPSRSLNYFATRPLRTPSSNENEAAPPAVQSETKPHAPRPSRETEQPEYALTFTCKPCGHRSSHRITKQGYHRGSVLITCPSCKNRHIISDNLGIFLDRKLTIEDLMKERNQLVKRGSLSTNGDIEFWDEGDTSEHTFDGPDSKYAA